MLDGKKGLRVTVSEEALRRLKSMPPEEQAAFQTLAVVEGLEFGNGVIEAEIAGAPAPDAGEGARGFVGIVFRLHSDMKAYDTFYLRPTNGRADDQERRITPCRPRPLRTGRGSGFARKRRRNTRRTRSRARRVDEDQDRRPRRSRAPLRHGQEQPTLIVNDVKTGAQGKGAVALSPGRERSRTSATSPSSRSARH